MNPIPNDENDEPIRMIEPIRSPSPGNSEAGTNTASDASDASDESIALDASDASDASDISNIPFEIPLVNRMDTITDRNNIFSIEDLDDYSDQRGDGLLANAPNSWRPSTSLEDEESEHGSIDSDYDLPQYSWPLDHVNIFDETSSIETGISDASDLTVGNPVHSDSQEEEPGQTRVQDQVNLVQQLAEGVPALSPVTGPQGEVNEETEAEQPQQPPQQQPSQQQLKEEQLVDRGVKRDNPHEDDGDDESPLSLSTKKQKIMDKKDDDEEEDGAGSSKI